MRTFAGFLIVLHLWACVPAWADDPAPAPERDYHAAVVEQVLVERGVPAEQARAQTSTWSDDELAFFAENPNQIQVAGQIRYWWEWVGGAVWLVGVAVLAGSVLAD